MTFKKLALVGCLSAALGGCASFPENYQDDVGVPDIVNQYADAWASEAAVSYVPSASGASMSKYFTLPKDVAGRKVSIDLSASTGATVNDLIYAMRAQGYHVVSRLNKTGDTPLLVRNFNGTLGDFVDELSHVQNIGYEYRNGSLFILEANRFSVSLPQHEELLLQVAASLGDMGATDVRTDLLAGMVYFSAKPDISEYVTEYLDRIAQNSAMVRLQIAVVTVTLNRDINLGLDWGSIMAKTGTKDMVPLRTGSVQSYPGAGVNMGGGNNSGSNDSGAGNAISNLLAAGHSFAFNGASGLSYVFNSNTFSLSAAVKALSTFGTARTEQNVVLGTVSGMPVRISSGNDIPYVKSIGSSTSSGGSVTGSSQTEVIRSGLDLEVVPNFDSSDYSVVTTLNASMSSLVGFRELSAGLNLGTLSQPEMQNLEFQNVGRLRAGETIVVGGITYDQMSDNYNNLPGLERLPTGSKAQKVNKNAIYIVIRPTVIIFSRNADQLTELAQKKQTINPQELSRMRELTPGVQVKNLVDPRHREGQAYEPMNVRSQWLSDQSARLPNYREIQSLPAPTLVNEETQ